MHPFEIVYIILFYFVPQHKSLIGIFIFQIILLLSLISLVIAAPQFTPITPLRAAAPLLVPKPVIVQPLVKVASVKDDSKNAVILRYDSDNIGVGSYSYA